MLEILIVILLWILNLTPLWVNILGTVLMSLKLIYKILVLIVRFVASD